MDAYVRRKQWEAELLATKQAEATIKVWLESGMAETVLENQAVKLATEMWRMVHALRGSKQAPPSLFGKHKHNGDGLRQATGPDSFGALVEAAKREKEAQE